MKRFGESVINVTEFSINCKLVKIFRIFDHFFLTIKDFKNEMLA